jgi:hypothetical protein
MRRVRIWVVSLIGVVSLVWSVASFLGTQSPEDVEKRVGGWWERGERLVGRAAARVKEVTQVWWLGDRGACIRAAQSEFELTVASIIKSSVPTDGVNDYVEAGDPKAFALCINWSFARPDSQVTKAWGSATPRTVGEEPAAISTAISNCSIGQVNRAENCTCQIVSRNGVSEIKFPKNWSGGRCQ